MISVAAVGSASDAAGYYARDNYYTAPQAEGASAWAGEGAAELGLTGPVDAEQFEKKTELSENLRARSPMMKEAAAALNAGDISRAFEALRPVTTEVPRAQMPAVGASLWASLPGEERDGTLLIASGRAMRSAANTTAQAEMKAAGELGGRAAVLKVLDRVTSTREGARQERAYRPDHIVEFRTDLPSQQLRRGDRGTVVSVERGQVVLRMADGRHQLFLPDRLRRDLRQDAVLVYVHKEVTLHAGDRIRWTDNDHGRELLNAQLARVEKVGQNTVTISSLVDSTVHELPRGDRMLERLDLAYAINVHTAQGVTTDHGIVLMSARERQLASQSTFLVAVTRIADNATLVVDSGRDLERAVLGNSGEKTSALDVGASSPLSSASRVISGSRHPVSPQERLANDPSLDLKAIRVNVEPKAPDLSFLEKDISLEL